LSELFIVGNIVIDTLIHSNGSITKNAGGPPSFFLNYFFTSGQNINVVSSNPVPPNEYLNLNDDIARFLTKSSNSLYTCTRDYTRFTLDYSSSSKSRQLYLSAFAGEIDLEIIQRIPEKSTVILSPVFKEISTDFLRALESRTDLKTIIDPQGFFRVTGSDNRIAMSTSFDKVPLESFSVIKFSSEDISAVIRYNLDDFVIYIEKILNDYNKIIIISLGKKGAILFENGSIVHIPALSTNVVDETGAGDTFLAAFVDYLLPKGNTILAFKQASAVVSCFIESRGFHGLEDNKKITSRMENCRVEDLSDYRLKDLIKRYCL